MLRSEVNGTGVMSTTSSSNNNELVLLNQLLQDVELSQFSSKIVEELQVSRVSHFDYVTTEDLMGIGISKPAARRLLETVKKRKGTLKKKIIQTFINSSGNTKERPSIERIVEHPNQLDANTLTCLIKESDLKISTQLGDGSFGVVHKGEWVRPDGTSINVAVKVLKEDKIQQQAVYDDFVREVEAMHSLQHSCLIRLHGVVLSHPLMMVTELAPLGSLLDYLHKQCKHISLCSLWQWATQVSSGMAYLESRRLLHRDLACRNVFLTSSTQAKIGDFGLLRPLPSESDCYVMTEQRRVPFPWCAPESLKSRQFSLATDVWMFGITLWEMFTFGEEPWAGLSGHEILNKIFTKGERLVDPQAAPESLCKLLHRCWAANPANRPRFSEITTELSNTSPMLVRCKGEDRQDPAWDEPAGAQKLDLAEGDLVAVIDGRPDFYWWTGQCQRTFNIGIFPRCWTEPSGRRRNGEDISQPLIHSFIHTGHGSSSGPSWGSPSVIDEVYLRNPMEPMDILKLKDAPLAESPRRVMEVLKPKKQFDYHRLSEDHLIETTDSTNHIIPVSSSINQAVREEPLLIDLSPDTPATLPAETIVPYYSNAGPVETPFLTDQNRLYENYPSTSVAATTPAALIPMRDSVYSSHYYSEVPIEPIYSQYAALSPLNKTTSPPVSPVRPTVVMNEEMKKKRDEAFGWLNQAMAEISLSKSNSNSGHYSSISPLKKVEHKVVLPTTATVTAATVTGATASRYGFEDDFTSAHVSSSSPSRVIGGNFSQLNAATGEGRVPFLPKPGLWSDASASLSSQREPFTPAQYYSLHSTGGEQHQQQGISRQMVQTAHVRPFMVASSCATASTPAPVDVRAHLVSQVRASAPWASEAVVKQALIIHNSNLTEACKYLKVEKLYRLGLCSKAICLKALENTNFDMEKAASSLLDP